ncbi:transcriptional regulator, AlpA family [Cribrihabitans marinus]|uniref:Transcriptional regulator, AlpA family n=1 Tax=Cribrihabitans marinus TaxID=1227549 RepID=A0A1H6QFD9_9RHOB|nr:AlpA family transcriptional regulator [Cribrihabitans marinus]GGH18126.1 AlpA family phage regulatory protein [Cribrihabitans marinus]SEI39664.1 transcriptional regulator, AlpA family [Cribrihabitans marinus]
MTELSNLKILRRRDIELIIGLSRSTIYKMIADGDFPQPIKIGARAVGWRESDVSEWLDSRSQDDIEP